MRQNIQQLVGPVAQKEPADAPGLVGHIMDDRNPQGLCAVVDLVDVIDLDRQIRNRGAGPAQARRCHPDSCRRDQS